MQRWTLTQRNRAAAPAAVARLWPVLALVLASPLAGCSFFESSCDENTDPSCLGRDLTGGGLGSECMRTVQCDAYLHCIEGSCQPAGDTAEGGECFRTAECAEGLYCSHLRTCAPAGDGVVGDSCENSADCLAGLLCGLGEIPLRLECIEPIIDAELGRTLDKGDSCFSSAQCTPGLSCVPFEGGPVCRSIPVDLAPDIDGDGEPDEVPPIPVWTPDVCPQDVDEATAYFDVPRDGDSTEDFYRLPFPNDIRVGDDGTIDLEDHPKPPAIIGLPVATEFIDAADSTKGFSTNPVVYFRFSEEFNFDDVSAETAMIIDITPNSPEYGEEASLQWHTASSNYICDNWLALARPVGQPLRPATTYAAIITTGIAPEEGGAFSASDDLRELLGSSEPNQTDMRRAWERYAPLRDYLGDSGMSSGSILNAAVFTTQDPTALMQKIREAVQADVVPTVSSLTQCAEGVTSPCETDEGDGETRGACVLSGDGFVEIHGRISLASFQVGETPFLQPVNVGSQVAGDIKVDGGGDPEVVDHEQVCFSLAVPDGQAPAEGWPLLIYAHGTGGSFTGHLHANGWAEEAATGAQPAATLAIDMPQHGERRGESTEDPDVLFFNVLNPYAARGNVLQGSADLLSLVRWARDGGLSSGESPTGAAVRFDAARIAVLGHSQGATHASIMLPFEPDVAAGMLSGVGGHLSTSLLTKTEPLPIADFAGILLLDPESGGTELNAGGRNPGLALVQTFYEAADPINYAPLLMRNPPSSAPTGRHVFMSYGLDDHYTPEETQEAFALAGRIPLVGIELRDVPLESVGEPASGNVEIGGVMRTYGMHQYAPKAAANGDAVDGHFVAVRGDQDGFPDVSRFLRQVFAGMVPQIGN